MPGIDPYAYMQEVAVRLESLQDQQEMEAALDEMEYLYEVLDPEFQDQADAIIGRLRARLDRVRIDGKDP